MGELPENPADRAVGCLLGLAVGDALGFPHEGGPAAPAGRVFDMSGRGDLPPGTTSDDTAQAVALAESLVERGRFDPDDVAGRFLEWFRSGALGIGRTTLAAMEAMAAGDSWEEASRRAHDATGGLSAGNGAVMRCAPVAVFFRGDEAGLIDASVGQARLTHWDPLAGEAAAAVNLIVAGCLRGQVDRAQIVSEAAFVCDGRASGLLPAERAASPHCRVAETLREAASCDRDDLVPGSGFCLETLKTAASFFLTAGSFEDALSSCVGLGGDADTNGAVLGAMLGAYWGPGGIPDRWASVVAGSDRLRALAARLAAGPSAGA